MTAGSLGRALRATAVTPGHWVVEQRGYSPWYEASIEADGTALANVRMRAPALHSVSVSSKPSKGRPGLVRWSPNRDSVADDVQIRVLDQQTSAVTYDDHVIDSGEAALPATAFPSPATFVVQLRKAATISLAVPNSTAMIEVMSSTEVSGQ